MTKLMTRKGIGTFFVHASSVLLPASIATASFVAAVNHDQARFYWCTAAVIFGIVQATLGVVKEARKKRGEDTFEARKRSVQMRLAEASRLLVTALCKVSSANDFARRQADIGTLITGAVATLRAECGSGRRSNYRSSFYSLVGDRLDRVVSDGRPESTAARRTFDPNDPQDERQIDAQLAAKIARDEKPLFVDDLHSAPPPSITNPRGRSYRTMLVAPVNAGGQNFGILAIDSPDQSTLAEIDQRYILLIAGMIAAALVQLRRDGFAITYDGEFVQLNELEAP